MYTLWLTRRKKSKIEGKERREREDEVKIATSSRRVTGLQSRPSWYLTTLTGEETRRKKGRRAGQKLKRRYATLLPRIGERRKRRNCLLFTEKRRHYPAMSPGGLEAGQGGIGTEDRLW